MLIVWYNRKLSIRKTKSFFFTGPYLFFKAEYNTVNSKEEFHEIPRQIELFYNGVMANDSFLVTKPKVACCIFFFFFFAVPRCLTTVFFCSRGIKYSTSYCSYWFACVHDCGGCILFSISFSNTTIEIIFSLKKGCLNHELSWKFFVPCADCVTLPFLFFTRYPPVPLYNTASAQACVHYWILYFIATYLGILTAVFTLASAISVCIEMPSSIQLVFLNTIPVGF